MMLMRGLRVPVTLMLALALEASAPPVRDVIEDLEDDPLPRIC
jgi:hypothetical protein